MRCDRRDAAHCLLALGLTEAEAAAAAPAVEFAALRRFAHCSYAWVLGDAPEPTAGYTEAEREEGLPQLAAGEGGGGA